METSPPGVGRVVLAFSTRYDKELILAGSPPRERCNDQIRKYGRNPYARDGAYTETHRVMYAPAQDTKVCQALLARFSSPRSRVFKACFD
jgi:hypothetical protein